MYYSPANTWKVAARLHPRTKYGLSATSTSPAWPYPDPPPHPPLEPHYVIPLSHLHDPLYQAMPDPPLWWCPDGGTGGGGGTPGAPVNSVQFNNNGTFGGDPNLIWNSPNGLQLASTWTIYGSSTTFAIKYANSANYGDPISINQGNGQVTISAAAGASTLLIANPWINVMSVGGITPTGMRWDICLGNGNTESGGNTGSDFAVRRYNDTGQYISGGDPLTIVRSSGALRLGVTTNSSPQDGDLWYDGTHLNFHHGGTTTAIV